MAADKRALDDLDALFRAVPAKAVCSPRPVKRLRAGGTASASSLTVTKELPGTQNKDSAFKAKKNTSVHQQEQEQERLVYTSLPSALAPNGFRSAPSTPYGGSRKKAVERNNTTTTSRAATGTGVAAANRLTAFIRGMLGEMRGDRAVTAAIEAQLEGKVIRLENVAPDQTTAQSAGAARAGRAVRGATKRGLSGNQCKQMGLNALKARDGGSISFLDLLGLHDVWKDYAARLMSQCSNQKALHQRILSADLQGCYLTVSRASVSSLVNVAGIVLRETASIFQLVTPDGKTLEVPKRSCAVRLAFAGHVVTLNGRALEGRRGGGRQQTGKERGSGTGGGAGDPIDFSLATAAL